jgi:hypothetical protein
MACLMSVESKTERAKAEALDKASEAIGLLREIGIDNDTIKELGFMGRTSRPAPDAERSIIRAKPAVVNGDPRSLTKTAVSFH